MISIVRQRFLLVEHLRRTDRIKILGLFRAVLHVQDEVADLRCDTHVEIVEVDVVGAVIHAVALRLQSRTVRQHPIDVQEIILKLVLLLLACGCIVTDVQDLFRFLICEDLVALHFIHELLEEILLRIQVIRIDRFYQAVHKLLHADFSLDSMQ